MAKRDILTTDDAAVLLGMSKACVRRHAQALGGRKLPGCRRWLFSRARLIELVEKRSDAA